MEPQDRRRRLLRALAGLALLAALALAAVLRSAWGTRLDSMTVDEPYHVVAGVEYVRTGDFRLNPEHPPLVKLWVGAWMPESFELRPFAPLADKPAERDFTEETFFLANDARAAQARARLSMWVLKPTPTVTSPTKVSTSVSAITSCWRSTVAPSSPPVCRSTASTGSRAKRPSPIGCARASSRPTSTTATCAASTTASSCSA